MKTLATIILAFVAIIASLFFVLSSVCAFSGGFTGTGDRPPYIVCAIIALAVIIGAIFAISKINRKSAED